MQSADCSVQSEIADFRLEIADSLVNLIRERGPLTVAAFMEFALYDERFGYYARAARRSGRAGDFFTSVDVGALFGRLLAQQLAEMAECLGSASAAGRASPTNAGRASRTDAGRAFSGPTWDLVEAGAGNGQLSADVLRALQHEHPRAYDGVRLHLVEASTAARARQVDILGDSAGLLASSSARLPASYEGVLFANELLDALPVHQVVMRDEGLREVYVDVHAGSLLTREGPPSTPALEDYLARLAVLPGVNVALEPGWRVEINLAAVAWMREASERLRRGFIILIDYGHPARELYSVTHATGTLTSFSRHTMTGPDATAGQPPWLSRPGEQDITAHVDFTSVRMAAEAEGLVTLGLLDQTYFLMGLCGANSVNPLHPVNLSNSLNPSNPVNLVNPVNPSNRANLVNPVNPSNPANLVNPVNLANLKDRLALKTLMMPGGLGSTMKVLILGKGVGTPALQGCSYRMRVT